MAPKFNSKLAWAAYHEAEKDQEHWWQDSWRAFFSKPAVVTDDEGEGETARCGTTYCFGGWVAMLDHGRWLLSNKALAKATEDEGTYSPQLSNYLLPRKDERGAFTLVSGSHTGKEVITVEDRAINALGITAHEAWYLFSGDRTLEEIKAGIEKIESRRARDLEALF